MLIDYLDATGYYSHSMNNKNKKHTSKLKIILILIGVVLAVGAIAALIFQNIIRTAVADIQTDLRNQGKPKFVFDTAKFPDWATAGNVYTNPDDITDDGYGNKDDLPVSGMNISQCVTGSNCNKLVEKCDPWQDDKPVCKELSQSTMNTHCFVMTSYNDRTITSSDDEVAKYIAKQKSFGDYMTVREAGTKTLTMNTPEGDKEYTLHYYDYQNKGGDTIKHGNAIGYIALASGHIDIRSVCSEVNQLDETLQILSVVRLES